MQGGSVENVISLFSRPQEKSVEVKQAPTDSELSFAETMRRNAENRDRMARERAKANKNVIRSHRLKR